MTISVIGVVSAQLIFFSLKNSQAWGRKYPFVSQLEFLGLVYGIYGNNNCLDELYPDQTEIYELSLFSFIVRV